MADEFAVKIEGYSEAIRGLRKVSNELPQALKLELKVAADIVRVEAINLAGQQGLAAPGRSGRGTGALVGGLKTFATGSIAGVRDTANRNGFPYPRVYEFGHGKTRAFLYPAGAAKAGEVERSIDAMFNRLRSGAGLGGGYL